MASLRRWCPCCDDRSYPGFPPFFFLLLECGWLAPTLIGDHRKATSKPRQHEGHLDITLSASGEPFGNHPSTLVCVTAHPEIPCLRISSPARGCARCCDPPRGLLAFVSVLRPSAALQALRPLHGRRQFVDRGGDFRILVSAGMWPCSGTLGRYLPSTSCAGRRCPAITADRGSFSKRLGKEP